MFSIKQQTLSLVAFFILCAKSAILNSVSIKTCSNASCIIIVKVRGNLILINFKYLLNISLNCS